MVIKGGLEKRDSIVEVWLFPGTTQYMFSITQLSVSLP